MVNVSPQEGVVVLRTFAVFSLLLTIGLLGDRLGGFEKFLGKQSLVDYHLFPLEY